MAPKKDSNDNALREGQVPGAAAKLPRRGFGASGSVDGEPQEPKAKKAKADKKPARPPPIIPEGLELRCLKCQDPVTADKASSRPAGSNELRRVCVECNSTDRTLNKHAQKEGDAAEDGEIVDAAFAQGAKKIKADLGKMSAGDRVAWYKKQKDDRIASKEQNGGTPTTMRRRFSDSKAEVRQEEEEFFGEKELGHFITFKMFKAEGGYKNEEDAVRDWKAALENPMNTTKFCRNQWLLSEFKGVLCEKGSQSRLVNALKQAQMVKSEKDLEEFKAAGDAAKRKFDAIRDRETAESEGAEGPTVHMNPHDTEANTV